MFGVAVELRDVYHFACLLDHPVRFSTRTANFQTNQLLFFHRVGASCAKDLLNQAESRSSRIVVPKNYFIAKLCATSSISSVPAVAVTSSVSENLLRYG